MLYYIVLCSCNYTPGPEPFHARLLSNEPLPAGAPITAAMAGIALGYVCMYICIYTHIHIHM